MQTLMSSKKQLAEKAEIAFHKLIEGKQRIPTVGGQMVGCESYRIRCSGFQIGEVSDAFAELLQAVDAPAHEPTALQEICAAIGIDEEGDAATLHARALKGIEALHEELKLTVHKVITCGVIATHPDANLSRTKAYAGKWNSQQAEAVRKLRAERDTLLAERNAQPPSAGLDAHTLRVLASALRAFDPAIAEQLASSWNTKTVEADAALNGLLSALRESETKVEVLGLGEGP